MREIRISDATMKQTVKGQETGLSFKEKIELAKLLDKLGVNIIEIEGISRTKVDSLRIKSIASAVKKSTVAVPVGMTVEGVADVWAALKEAVHPRLQVVTSVSAVQMVYQYGKKLPAMLESISELVKACRALCSDVEFIAEDATRSDAEALASAITAAIEAGASTITVDDTAGAMLPDEFGAFVEGLYASTPALKGVVLGVSCSNALSMADACAITAIRAGAGEIKASAYPIDMISLQSVARVLNAKGDGFGARSGVGIVEIGRTVNQIGRMFENRGSKNGPVGGSLKDGDAEGISLNIHDDMNAVNEAVKKLGYDLSDDDLGAVYDAFRRIASRKDSIDMRELDAMVASAAMQVPPAFTIDHYVVTSGTAMGAMAHLKVVKDGVTLEGVAGGNGPIDAAFGAVESATGCHYELDDFQIRAVTEGHEAMGETVVRLVSDGRLYSGRGISTDVVASGIQAYINAINKIVYEEAEA